MMELALRIAADNLHKYNERGTEALDVEAQEPFRPTITVLLTY